MPVVRPSLVFVIISGLHGPKIGAKLEEEVSQVHRDWGEIREGKKKGAATFQFYGVRDASRSALCACQM